MKVDNETSKFELDWVAPEFFEYFLYHYYVILEVLMFFLSIIDIVIISIMFYVFNKSPQFHYHLIALIKLIYVFFITYGSLKIILTLMLCIFVFEDVNQRTLVPKELLFVEYFKMMFGVAYLASLPGFTLERIWATICLENYEKKQSKLFLIAMFLVQFGGGLIFATSMFIFPGTVFYGALIGILLSFMQMFVSLSFKNIFILVQNYSAI